MKRADDAFYKVPAGDKAADAYFAQRAARYQQWTADYAPLVARCLGRARGADPALTLNFLYQDLFFGARAQGQSEHDMLHLLSTLGQALAGHDPAQVRAVIAPSADEDELLLVQLAQGDTPLAAAGKPLDPGADLDAALADLADALASLGISDIAVSEHPLS
jgi:hypothetical protein